MNAMPQQQRMSALLAQVATVAKVKATSLGLGRTDKGAGALAERDHNAKSGIARVTVSRLAGAEDRVKEIRTVQMDAREILESCTTAWGDRRLLPNVNIEPFLQKWSPKKAEFQRLVGQLEDDAFDLIEKATMNLGNFDIEPPTVEEIKSAFTLDFQLEQVPDSSSYHSNLDKQIEQALQARFEADVQAAYQLAQKDALQRVAKPVQNLLERMTAYSKREEEKARGISVGKEGFFRDAVITNVKEIAAVFGSFNLTGDPLIAAMADELEAFAELEPDDLRNSLKLREDTAKRAAAILEKLGDWL